MIQNDKSGTLACNNDQTLIIINDQGGAVMNIEKNDVAPTLRSQTHQHEPIVCFDPKWLSATENATSIMGDNAKDNPCICYTQSSFGTYQQGIGSVRASGGDAGGGAKPLLSADDRSVVL